MKVASRDDGLRVFQRGIRVFAGAGDEPRARRASDVTSLIASLFVLTILGFAAEPLPGIVTALDEFVQAVPDVFEPVWSVGIDLVVVAAALVVVAALVRRRWSVARDQLLSAALAFGGGEVVGRLATGEWPDPSDSLTSTGPPQVFPALRLAIPAAVLIASSPHLVRPLRSSLRWIVGYASVSLLMLATTSVVGMLAGLFVAIAAGATVNLVFGSSAGRPSLQLVGASLAELGVAVQSIGVADRQEAGFFLVTATDDHGRPLVVKVYGRDAHDAALMSTLWRTVWYREAGTRLRLRRIEQVEHEAFVTLLAAQAGVPTDTVVTAAVTEHDDALFVVRRRAPSIASCPPSDDDAAWDQAVQIWGVVDVMHAAGIAHGQLDRNHLTVVPAAQQDDELGSTGGTIGVMDFRVASAAATDLRLRTDEVQVLFSTVELLGPMRAIECAMACVGRDRIAQLVPLLQLPSLTRAQVATVKAGDVDLDELRREVAATVGIDAPELQQLRRVNGKVVVQLLLAVFALFAVYFAFSDVSWDELIDEVQDATWWIVAIGFVVAQMPRLAQSCSTLGASPVRLPFGPVYALQLAMSYINLAIPSSAARVATSVRFFQRHGLATGAALATGAIDGFAGFVVQAVVLLAFLVFTPLALDLDFSGTGSLSLIGWVVAVAVVSIVAVLAVGRWRRFVFGWIRRLLTEARSALHGVRSPRRLALLFGGNLGSDLLFALALTTMVAAFGYDVSFAEVLLINIVVSLFAGLLPIPGGIGVTEGGLVYGLTEAGVPESVAIAAVIVYRLATFYLPPTWGFFAFRWLERNNHL
jgi:uncharacterized protein (TIRG00374 family)